MSIANLGFIDYAESADADGVFREIAPQQEGRKLAIDELLGRCPQKNYRSVARWALREMVPISPWSTLPVIA